MAEDEVRIFMGEAGAVLSEEELRDHLTIGENVSIMVAALEEVPDYADKATSARKLVGEGKAVFWTVADLNKVPYIAGACYIRPEPLDNALIPAMVFNRFWSQLTKAPSTWDQDTSEAVVNAIINLETAYLAGVRFTIYRLIDKDQFFHILSEGNPARQQIIPIWDLVRR